MTAMILTCVGIIFGNIGFDDVATIEQGGIAEGRWVAGDVEFAVGFRNAQPFVGFEFFDFCVDAGDGLGRISSGMISQIGCLLFGKLDDGRLF